MTEKELALSFIQTKVGKIVELKKYEVDNKMIHVSFLDEDEMISVVTIHHRRDGFRLVSHGHEEEEATPILPLKMVLVEKVKSPQHGDKIIESLQKSAKGDYRLGSYAVDNRAVVHILTIEELSLVLPCCQQKGHVEHVSGRCLRCHREIKRER